MDIWYYIRYSKCDLFLSGFTFISVIVILNMLIACMSNTMTKITENVIVEWTFGRTEVRDTINYHINADNEKGLCFTIVEMFTRYLFRLTLTLCSRPRYHRRLISFQRTLVFNLLSSIWKYGWNQPRTNVHDGIRIIAFISLVHLTFYTFV